MFSKVILIGFGSIGKRHARSVSGKCKSLIIVDPNEAALSSLPDGVAPNTHFLNIDELEGSDSPEDMVIVANWGPDHWQTIKKCVDLGFLNFVVEKPISSSLSDLYSLRNLIQENSLRVVVNQGWDSQALGERIRELGNKLGLGEPVAVWVTGGARCASTAGSHYIHLATTVLNECPEGVMAHGSSFNINPRGKHLAFYDGVYSASYQSGKKFSMSFSNMSSIEGEVRILWKDASGEFSNDGELTISGRDPGREYLNVITRYGQPEVKLFSGTPPFKNDLDQDPFFALYRSLKEFSTKALCELFERNALSNEILLRMLLSIELKRQISLEEKIEEQFLDLDFRIS
jgi:hypothetical protein